MSEEQKSSNTRVPQFDSDWVKRGYNPPPVKNVVKPDPPPPPPPPPPPEGTNQRKAANQHDLSVPVTSSPTLIPPACP
jgi:hypothetical protein